MILKCVAIDDEPLALELIKNYVSRIPSLQLLQVFEDAISGAEYLAKNKTDILFLDINMPDISGIDLARSLNEKPMIIFTTAYKQFAFEGFELEAIDYLLKPIEFDRFSKAVEKAKEYYNYKNGINDAASQESIYVNSEYRLVKIPLNEVEYFESLEDYVHIHISAEKPVLTLTSLKKIMEKLPADKFIRIHRSYIIPMDKIHAVQNRRVTLSRITLPVGDSYAEKVKEWLANKK